MTGQDRYLALLGIPRWQQRQRGETPKAQAPEPVAPQQPRREQKATASKAPQPGKPAPKPAAASAPAVPVAETVTELHLASQGSPEWLWLVESTEYPDELLAGVQRAVLGDAAATVLLSQHQGDKPLAADQFDGRSQVRCCVVFGPAALADYRAWSRAAKDWPRDIHVVIAPRLAQLAGDQDAKRELWGRLQQLMKQGRA